MSGRHYSPRSSEYAKDTMIDSLHAENHDLRHHDGNIEVLEETLHSVEYALDKATGERLKLENDFKIQVDNDAITINRLKNEGIDLKHALADRNEELARLRSTLSNLKYTVDLKSGDMSHLNEEFRIHKDDNDHLKHTASGLDADLRAEIDINAKLRSDLDGLHRKIDDGDARQRELESANNSSRSAQDRLNRDIDELEHRIRDITAQISVLEGKARGLRIDLDHLEST
jgi:predicted  nucleic acid-binding Zn-ribbon protein